MLEKGLSAQEAYQAAPTQGVQLGEAQKAYAKAEVKVGQVYRHAYYPVERRIVVEPSVGLGDGWWVVKSETGEVTGHWGIGVPQHAHLFTLVSEAPEEKKEPL